MITSIALTYLPLCSKQNLRLQGSGESAVLDLLVPLEGLTLAIVHLVLRLLSLTHSSASQLCPLREMAGVARGG